MFGKNKNNTQETKQNYSHEEVQALKDSIKTLREELTDSEIGHQRELAKIRFDNELDIKKLENEIQERITSQVKSMQLKLIEAEKNNAVLSKELEVYNKAFENMGMDVKDVKDVVNKLVDGLIAKNEIKLIKS